MSFAFGIDSHPQLKLGLRGATPAVPRLRLANFLTGVMPPIPKTTDYLRGVEFGMYNNDQFGVCGPTSAANYRRLLTVKLTGQMVAPSQDDVYKLYRQSGNPNFDPRTGQDDNGVNMQQMLQAMVDYGIGSTKALGFAQVDPSNLDEMDAAVALFGGILDGVMLQQAQQGQTDQTGIWDYVPSSQWGGHAVLDGGFPTSGHLLISWAKRLKMTDQFIRRQLQEAWVVIFPEHLRDNAFLQGVNMEAFANAFTQLTGKRFPAIIPPSPKPTPQPAPQPAGAPTVTVVMTLPDGSQWEADGKMRPYGSAKPQVAMVEQTLNPDLV